MKKANAKIRTVVPNRSSARLNPTAEESILAAIGPIASPTPKKLLKNPAETLFSTPPFKCGSASSIDSYISGNIGTIRIAALKPSRQRPKKMILVLSGIIKMGLVPIMYTLRAKVREPISKTARLFKTLQ